MPAEYLETRDVPIKKLARFPGNAKRGDVGVIRGSIVRRGQYRSLIVRQHEDGTLTVLAGNNTLDALAGIEGKKTARCEIIRCTDEEAREINVADNRLGELGDYDTRALAELINGIDSTAYASIGYDDQQVDELFRATDLLGDAATGFLADYTGDPPDPGPEGGTPGAPPASASAEGSDAPGGAPAPPNYVQLTYSCLPEDRDVIRAALRLGQARWELPTAIDALVHLCRGFLLGQEVAEDDRETVTA